MPESLLVEGGAAAQAVSLLVGAGYWAGGDSSTPGCGRVGGWSSPAAAARRRPALRRAPRVLLVPRGVAPARAVLSVSPLFHRRAFGPRRSSCGCHLLVLCATSTVASPVLGRDCWCIGDGSLCHLPDPMLMVARAAYSLLRVTSLVHYPHRGAAPERSHHQRGRVVVVCSFVPVSQCTGPATNISCSHVPRTACTPPRALPLSVQSVQSVLTNPSGHVLSPSGTWLHTHTSCSEPSSVEG